MHPADMIFFWAEVCPHELALLQPNASLTYRELAQAVTGISQRLAALNLPKDEPVAVAIEEPGKRLAVCFALLRLGIAAAPIRHPMLPLMRASGIPNTIYTGHGQVISGGRNVRFEDSWLKSAGGSVGTWDPGQASPAADTSLIFFTSGSTGVPKKVVIPGAALMERVALLARTEEALTDRTLVVPGLSSSFGFSRAAQVMHAGRTVCVAGDVTGMLRMIDLFGVGTVIGSPQQILALVAAVDNNPALQPTVLQQVVIGGAFASPELFRRVQVRVPECHLQLRCH